VVTQPADNDQPPAEPLLRVVRGDADPSTGLAAEEIAALVAVLMAFRAADDGAGPASSRSAWADRPARLHMAPHPGPGAWRRSALPG
jgi:Acyl-CoA carboxylase epsilon subunit